MRRPCTVYILSSANRSLYVGVTSNLPRRLQHHFQGRGSAHVKQGGHQRLVHVEVFSGPTEAIAREKQIKGWRRIRKVALVEGSNPDWIDLAAGWGWGELLKQ